MRRDDKIIQILENVTILNHIITVKFQIKRRMIYTLKYDTLKITLPFYNFVHNT